MKWIPFFAIVVAVLFIGIGELPADETGVQRLAKARQHFQKGRYEEAAETLEKIDEEKIADVDPAQTAFLRSEIQLAQGQRDAAKQTIVDALAITDGSALLHAQLAKILYDRGIYSDAEIEVNKSLSIDANQLLARLIHGFLLTERGELKQADDQFLWFISYYNKSQPKDAESLVLIALGASQYAHWHSNSQIFDFCVNTVANDALAADKNFWQARLMSGRLLIEKYNKAQGRPELKSALTINPNAAEVHIELARSAVSDYDWDDVEEESKRALEICPGAPGALQALARSKLYFHELEAAEKLINEALAINPVENETLALEVTLRMLQDGWPEPGRWRELINHIDHIADLKLENLTRCEQILIDVATRNPKPGIFLSSIADLVEMFRQYSVAEPLLTQAILLMPQLSQPKNVLGQLYMQTGQIELAKKTLDEAFSADPYHVRVSNMRKVIKVLNDYEYIQTPHFVVRADEKLDKLLARYVSEYLEEVYPELVKKFGFEPEARTQIEIYNNAKGLSGHQWFSARMVGLPWVQTIGASTGVIIAMQSPGSMSHPLNWARVLKHEFVHILTLQQTKFNIPHWYTEALAVRSEGYSNPVEWNTLLLNRVPKRELKNLDTLTMGFVRAGTPENWSFAYCQSVLYADYMVERAGEDSLARLLDAYRRNLTNDQAIKEVFGVEKSEFETGYLQFLDKLVSKLKKSEEPIEPKPADVEKAYEKNKNDPKAAADYARLMLTLKKRPEAKKIAEEVLKKTPNQPVATVVLATLLMRDNKIDEAAKMLEAAFDRADPDYHVADLLMKARLKQQRADDVFELCDVGIKHFPNKTDWWRGKAAAAKMTGQTERRRMALEALVSREPDDASPRKALAEMALADERFDEAFKYCKLALQIDVTDAEIHRMFAAACHGKNDNPRAIEEYETALELKPGDLDIQIGLIDAYLTADRKKDAKKLIDEASKKNADDKRLAKLRDQLK